MSTLFNFRGCRSHRLANSYASLPALLFSSRYLVLSYKHRLYLIHITFLWLRRKHFHTLVCTTLTRSSRWGQNYSFIPCWFPIFIRHLGFNLMLSNLFFLLSLHSHLCLFHPYVVVKLALRSSSIFVCFVGTIIFQIEHYAQVSLYADYFVNVRLLMTEVTSVRSRFNQ